MDQILVFTRNGTCLLCATFHDESASEKEKESSTEPPDLSCAYDVKKLCRMLASACITIEDDDDRSCNFDVRLDSDSDLVQYTHVCGKIVDRSEYHDPESTSPIISESNSMVLAACVWTSTVETTLSVNHNLKPTAKLLCDVILDKLILEHGKLLVTLCDEDEEAGNRRVNAYTVQDELKSANSSRNRRHSLPETYPNLCGFQTNFVEPLLYSYRTPIQVEWLLQLRHQSMKWCGIVRGNGEVIVGVSQSQCENDLGTRENGNGNTLFDAPIPEESTVWKKIIERANVETLKDNPSGVLPVPLVVLRLGGFLSILRSVPVPPNNACFVALCTPAPPQPSIIPNLSIPGILRSKSNEIPDFGGTGEGDVEDGSQIVGPKTKTTPKPKVKAKLKPKPSYMSKSGLPSRGLVNAIDSVISQISSEWDPHFHPNSVSGGLVEIDGMTVHLKHIPVPPISPRPKNRSKVRFVF